MGFEIPDLEYNTRPFGTGESKERGAVRGATIDTKILMESKTSEEFLDAVRVVMRAQPAERIWLEHVAEVVIRIAEGQFPEAIGLHAKLECLRDHIQEIPLNNEGFKYHVIRTTLS